MSMRTRDGIECKDRSILQMSEYSKAKHDFNLNIGKNFAEYDRIPERWIKCERKWILNKGGSASERYPLPFAWFFHVPLFTFKKF